MRFRLQIPGGTNEVISQNVVDVTMCIDQPDRLELSCMNKFFQNRLLLRTVTSRINNEAFFLVVPDEPGVFLKRIECEAVKM